MRQSILQASDHASDLAVAAKARIVTMLAALRRTRIGAYLLSLKGAIAALEVLLVIGCAYQASRLFWVLAAPSTAGVTAGVTVGVIDPQASTAPARPYRLPEVTTVTTADLFRSARHAGTPVAAPAPATTLNLQLFGVRTGGPGRSSAIIRRPDNSQDVFVPGQEIIDGVVLEEVAADRVIIRRMGVPESLFLDPSRIITAPPATQTSTPTAAAPDGPVPAATGADAPRRRIPSAPAQLFAAIAISPGKTQSGQAGLIMRPRGDDALFRDAGFEAGDVLLSVNGQAVSDLSRAASAIQAIGNARSFTVAFERAGQTLTQRLVVDR